MRYPHLWARVYGTPVFMHPEKAKMIEEVLRAHLWGESGKARLMEDDEEDPRAKAEREQERRTKAYTGLSFQNKPEKPYAITERGTAMLPLLGTLVQRGSWMDAMSGLTSYDFAASLLERALSDPDVRAVMLEIDSPGGEGNGLPDFADRVHAAGKRKPVWASANEQAYSAAYWIGASAQKLFVPVMGGVGSIGALALHVDQTKRDQMMGLSYTIIRAGDRKARMNPHEKLDSTGLKWIQAEVDRARDLFVQAVALRRGLSADDVYATEAELLTPEQALAGRFVDGIATLVDAVQQLEAEAAKPGSTTGTRLNAGPTKEISMSNAAGEKKHTDEQLEAARVAARAEGKAEGIAEGKVAGKAEGATEGEKTGRTAGIKAERERVGAILGCQEADGRAKQALHLALQTDTGIEEAKKMLGASAKEAGSQLFAQLMAGQVNPKVGLDADAAVSDKPKISSASEIFARRKQEQQQKS
jgi:signal peptide peptidase SppA